MGSHVFPQQNLLKTPRIVREILNSSREKITYKISKHPCNPPDKVSLISGLTDQSKYFERMVNVPPFIRIIPFCIEVVPGIKRSSISRVMCTWSFKKLFLNWNTNYINYLYYRKNGNSQKNLPQLNSEGENVHSYNQIVTNDSQALEDSIPQLLYSKAKRLT